eukprot:10016064-Lingulodinium_polyedra.AAC.1
MEGFVVATLESVIGDIGICTSAPGNLGSGTLKEEKEQPASGPAAGRAADLNMYDWLYDEVIERARAGEPA